MLYFNRDVFLLNENICYTMSCLNLLAYDSETLV